MFKDGKNDFYSEGAERIVAARLGRGAYCPVEFTKNYFCFLGSGYNGYLVPSCLPNARPNPLKNLLYPAALEDLRRLLTDLGHDSRLYGEHSGKRGGGQPLLLKMAWTWRPCKDLAVGVPPLFPQNMWTWELQPVLPCQRFCKRNSRKMTSC